ncbi:MAG: hypothetical protein R3C18_05235 [Planctomycetaceae bacterium]
MNRNEDLSNQHHERNPTQPPSLTQSARWPWTAKTDSLLTTALADGDVRGRFTVNSSGVPRTTTTADTATSGRRTSQPKRESPRQKFTVDLVTYVQDSSSRTYFVPHPDDLTRGYAPRDCRQIPKKEILWKPAYAHVYVSNSSDTDIRFVLTVEYDLNMNNGFTIKRFQQDVSGVVKSGAKEKEFKFALDGGLVQEGRNWMTNRFVTTKQIKTGIRVIDRDVEYK